MGFSGFFIALMVKSKTNLKWSGSLAAMAEHEAAIRNVANLPHSSSQPRRRSKSWTYHEYLASPAWAKKRRKALKHYGHRCTVCGSRLKLEVHHRHYRTLYRESVADLDVLCHDCHQNTHEGLKGYVRDSLTGDYIALVRSF